MIQYLAIDVTVLKFVVWAAGMIGFMFGGFLVPVYAKIYYNDYKHKALKSQVGNYLKVTEPTLYRDIEKKVIR